MKVWSDTWTQGGSNRQVALNFALPSAFEISYKSKTTAYAQLIVGKTYGTLDYIINHNFDKEEVQKWINEKKPKVQPQPQPQPQPINDEFEEKVKEIYDELEDGYGISGFIDEEAAKDKIRELKLDREEINQWIENTLLNGE